MIGKMTLSSRFARPEEYSFLILQKKTKAQTKTDCSLQPLKMHV